jgi:hypothetical protein
MATVQYLELVESYEKFPKEAPKLLRDALRNKHVDSKSFDFGRLFEQCFGWQEFQACRSDRGRLVTTDVFEAAGAVNTGAFKDIAGQIVYQLVLDKYEDEQFIFSKMIPERQSPYDFEKIAGLTRIGPGNDEDWITEETEAFQTVGFGSNYIHLPTTKKRGKICPVTREAIFFDRTAQIQDRAGEVGYWLGYNRECRAIDCVIDENGGAKSAADGGHRYHWRNTSYATYADLNSTTHPWDNLAASNALVDWSDIDAMDQLLNEITDPMTGAPFLINADTLIVCKGLEKTAMRIADATGLHVMTPGYALTANPTLHDNANPYSGKFTVMSSRLLAQRSATDTSYWYGNPKRAFVYVVNFPFKTTQSPPNSHLEFNNDIVLQHRSDERGAYGTIEPRLMVKSNA